MNNTELGKRAVACKHWRWMPGMRCTHRWTGGIRLLVNGVGDQTEDYIVVPGPDCNVVASLNDYGIMGDFPHASSSYPFVPDFDDPATFGCLLALVRKAWGTNNVGSEPGVPADFGWGYMGWEVTVYDPPGSEHGRSSDFEADSEAEALVAALEAAP